MSCGPRTLPVASLGAPPTEGTERDMPNKGPGRVFDRRDLAAVGGPREHRGYRAAPGRDESLVHDRAECGVGTYVAEYPDEPSLDNRIGEEGELKLLEVPRGRSRCVHPTALFGQ